MKRHLVLAAAALALAATSTTHAAAQRRPVSLIVGLGPVQGSSLGYVADSDGGTSARLLGSTAPMLGIQAPTPIRGVDLRVTAQHSTPALAMQSADGYVVKDHAGVTSLTADLVINLPHVGPIRPYLLAGAGVRYYEFHERTYFADGASVAPQDALVPTLHLGAGAAWKVGPAEMFTEASLVSGHYSAPNALPGGRTVANVGFTLGMRIPLGRR
ncbi:MAG TPA: hypothetical protein VFJ16_09940 [Longimicrobium sp.]|nr:hypothetical protein [Longimicrobium sp.]